MSTIDVVSRPKCDRIVISSEIHDGDPSQQGQFPANHAGSRAAYRTSARDVMVLEDVDPPSLPSDTVGIPQIIELDDTQTAVSGVDGSTVVGSSPQGQSNQDSNHIESSRSEDVTIFGLRQFLTRCRQPVETNSQGDMEVGSRSGLDTLSNTGDTGSKFCGIDFSKRANQLNCVLMIAFVVAVLFATLLGMRVIGQSLVVSLSQVGDDIDGENQLSLFGRSVALSSNGTILAIGASGDVGVAGSAGHVRVYINTGGRWEQRGRDLEGSETGDNFGFAVALSADGAVLVVGATHAEGVNGPDSGQVHTYQWISNSWQPIGSTLDGAGARDEFGFSLALSDDGTILAVGASRNNAGAGHVRVFEWTGRDWNQRGVDLVGSGDDKFGDSVSLSSDGFVLACGGDQGSPGYVRVYHWSGSAWQQRGSTLMGVSLYDDFGESVSLSGDGSIVAVGADIGNYAAVFRNDGTDWFQIGETIRGKVPDDGFGFSLSLSLDGNTLVIGGPWNGSNGSGSGHALVYRLSPNGQEWIQVGQELVGVARGDKFGYSTSISDDGNRIAIGALGNDGNGAQAGYVRVYDLQ